jgi:hypothetical protein
MSATYRDGIGLERCASCHSAIRSLTDDPIVSVPIGELEHVARGLGQIADTLAELVVGLERITGRSVAQLQAEIDASRARQAEAIPGDVKTDRAGLLDEEGDY